jgi:hypothetical protein
MKEEDNLEVIASSRSNIVYDMNDMSRALRETETKTETDRFKQIGFLVFPIHVVFFFVFFKSLCSMY